MIQQLGIGPAAGLGQHDAARTAADNRHEIGKSVRTLDGIDPHPEPMPLLRVRSQEGRNHRSRLGLFTLGHGILEVEEDDIRRAGSRLLHLALAVARCE
jgi:hypothetical protein